MVHIRLAHWDELPLLASICTIAFQYEPNHLHYNPLRSIYPEDWYRGILRELQERFIDQASVVILAEIDSEENGILKKNIAGCITGIRFGPDGRPMTSWAQRVADLGTQKATYSQLEQYRWSLLNVDQSADPVAIASFDKAVADVIGGSYANTIKVPTLAVLPQFQRSGVGKAFMIWCTRHAIKEGVTAVGKATKKGVPLYIAAGAEVVGTIEMNAQTLQPEGTDVTIELPQLDVPVIRFGASKALQQSKWWMEN